MTHHASGESFLSRRSFLQTSAANAAAATALFSAGRVLASSEEPAVLGGTPAVGGGWPGWPIVDEQEEQALRQVLDSGNWYRYAAGDASRVAQFEQAWAKDVGTPHSVVPSSAYGSQVAQGGVPSWTWNRASTS